MPRTGPSVPLPGGSTALSVTTGEERRGWRTARKTSRGEPKRSPGRGGSPDEASYW